MKTRTAIWADGRAPDAETDAAIAQGCGFVSGRALLDRARRWRRTCPNVYYQLNLHGLPVVRDEMWQAGDLRHRLSHAIHQAGRDLRDKNGNRVGYAGQPVGVDWSSPDVDMFVGRFTRNLDDDWGSDYYNGLNLEVDNADFYPPHLYYPGPPRAPVPWEAMGRDLAAFKAAWKANVLSWHVNYRPALPMICGGDKLAPPSTFFAGLKQEDAFYRYVDRPLTPDGWAVEFHGMMTRKRGHEYAYNRCGFGVLDLQWHYHYFSERNHRFATASAVLLDRGYISIASNYDEPTSPRKIWPIPWADIRLGRPYGDTYEVSDEGLYTRRYEGALVVVNPTRTTQDGVPPMDAVIRKLEAPVRTRGGVTC